MQLLSDAITVLGSRHGLLLSPHRRSMGLIRFDRFDEAPSIALRAGLRVDGRELIFPFSEGGILFALLDQRMTPCTSVFIGLDPASGIKVTLRIVTPFKPRDADFSTIPIIGLEMMAEPMGGQFRWEAPVAGPPLADAEVFLEIDSEVFAQSAGPADSVDLRFQAAVRASVPWTDFVAGQSTPSHLPQHDRLVVLNGRLRNGGFHAPIRELDAANPVRLRIGWCTWSPPILRVQGDLLPFRYARTFPDLSAVADWFRLNGASLFQNADRVDAIVGSAEVGACTKHLLAQTLHSWLACTWWTDRGPKGDWFSVWEGNCYFHSTVDVEFTQSPFYLAVWPELLALELAQWPEFERSGEPLLGERGRGTLFLSHDCGSFTGAEGQSYPHDMEVEETANYIILAFAYSRRTGDVELPDRFAPSIAAYLRFLVACDTQGNGVPDVGVANTVDDGSPAIQYGGQQTYLAVKTIAALEAGCIFADRWRQWDLARDCRRQIDRIRRTLEHHGWARDHFVVLLKPGGELTDPWSGRRIHYDNIPGWDAPHIYTANTLPLMDMIGFDLRLDPARVRQDLVTATRRCLREYGCVHTDFESDLASGEATGGGLAGIGRRPGWISMNIVRDLAAIYRGIDLRRLAESYWDWQLTTNSRETTLFFETFGGNNLQFYPRGVVIWGIFEALAGVALDRISGISRRAPGLAGVRVPFLFTADWNAGTAEMISND